MESVESIIKQCDNRPSVLETKKTFSDQEMKSELSGAEVTDINSTLKI